MLTEDKGNKLEFAVSLINCQSICNETNEVVDCVKDQDVHSVALTETWLSVNEHNNNKVIGLKEDTISKDKHKTDEFVDLVYKYL